MTERSESISEFEILDHQTGLVWRKDYEKGLDWDAAMEYPKSLGPEWRLPTRHELDSLLSLERHAPAWDFPDMPSNWFWSSSSLVNNPDYAWGVSFYYGYMTFVNKTFTFYARCVRDGGE